MAYTRLHWVESETPLSADNMNNIEDGIEELKAQKVDKVSGKSLSDQNYTAAEKTKLAGIAEGAEVNVQPDWNQTNTSADDYIQNKPGNASSSEAGFMTAADKTKLDGVQAGAQVNRTYTAVTGKPTAAASPAFGGTVTVSQVAQDANGQVSVTDRVITIPGNDATTSAHGLMTAADKTKLNGIETGATKNTAVATTSANGLMSSSDKTKLNGIAAGAQVNPGNATTSAAGLMSASDKSKLNGIATGAEVNQNAFSNVKVGSTTLAADSKTDTLNITSGNHIVILPTAESDSLSIATDLEDATTSAAGLMSAADKAKLNGITAHAIAIGTQYTSFGGFSLTVPANSMATRSLTFASIQNHRVLALNAQILGADDEALNVMYTLDYNDVSAGKCDIKIFNPTSSSVTIKKINATAVYGL